MEKPVEIIKGIIADAVYAALKRLCNCVKARAEHVDDVELARVADDVMKAISEGRDYSSDIISVNVERKLLKRRVRVFFKGRELSLDEAFNIISRARSTVAWLESDCSRDVVLEPILETADRFVIEYVSNIYDQLTSVCEGRLVPMPQPSPGTPGYVVEGVVAGITKFVNESTPQKENI